MATNVKRKDVYKRQVEQGLRAEEAQELLQTFFKDLRARLAARPKWKPSV